VCQSRTRHLSQTQYINICVHQPCLSARLASLDLGGVVLAVVGRALVDGRGLGSGFGALELLADDLDRRSAGVGDGGST
jgi:hypothetical protein